MELRDKTPEELKKILGERIKRLRKEKNLTLKQLGELMGVSESAISVWETGQYVPSYRMIILLCETLNITADELIFGEDTSKRRKCKTPAHPNECRARTVCENSECKLAIGNLTTVIESKDQQLKLKDELIITKDELIEFLKKTITMLESQKSNK